MTRMIERWFPSAEVSANSSRGWGSGNSEISLFMWFAKRPTAQAKAAVVCSLLQGELRKSHPEGAAVLDPFSGRGMIPLEAARLGISSYAIDYSPVAVLASSLLTSEPFVDWTNEPPLPFDLADHQLPASPVDRLLHDLEVLFNEVGRRHVDAMSPVYPKSDTGYPWGYLWAVSIDCQDCGRRFPLIGSYSLTLARGSDTPVSFYIDADRATNRWKAVVHDG